MIQLPAREDRFNEPPATTYSEIEPSILAALRPYAADGLFLFGHSLGGLIAFHIASVLADMGMRPRHLLLSGCRPPLRDVILSLPITSQSPDRELRAFLAIANGTRVEVLNDEDLMRILGDLLRSDLRLFEDVVTRPAKPLPIPITAFAGDDDTIAPIAEMLSWALLTSSQFSLTQFPGPHSYINGNLDKVAQAIRIIVNE